MYLKRLELVGFKSFAGKTVLEFPKGIAAVVGPNGSGKSNIIDAVRWILGEREAKNMRSLKAENLIFSGTPLRPRVSLAQATMVFDNVSRFFPVDYSEVSVRRRLSRDGTSRHFLNDAEVRLKDIVDFFAKSRLGTRGFSIVNQGDSDLFVRSTGKERRAMLEEILGLRQYQLKKHDAELKLKATRLNMERVQALVSELMPHLRILRRQTAKWEKHGDLERELRDLETCYFGAKLYELAIEEKKVEPSLKALESGIRERRVELQELERKLNAVRSKAPKEKQEAAGSDREKRELLEKRALLERALGRLEARAELALEGASTRLASRELIRLLEEARETIEDVLYETNLARIKTLLKSLFEKMNRVLEGEESDRAPNDGEGEFARERVSIAKELQLLNKKLSGLGEAERAESEELRNFNRVFREAFEAFEKKKNEIAALEADQGKFFLERERVSMRREELANQARQGMKNLQEFEVAAPPPAFDSASAERHLFKLRAELAGIGEIDPALLNEAEETEARHRFLSGQLRDLEKALKDLTELVRELDRKIHLDFKEALKSINSEFQRYFRMMFGGGQAKLTIEKRETPDEMEVNGGAGAGNREDNSGGHEIDEAGIDVSISIPTKRITSLDMLSGGEKSLVSLAVLFALISVSPPPFLVLDEVDAALDEANTGRFATIIKEFGKKTQFLIVTHNRATMEAADLLYGITMGEDGISKVLSLKLE